ncbi:unnamed protein product, partial [Ascophyllum nodosum]
EAGGDERDGLCRQEESEGHVFSYRECETNNKKKGTDGRTTLLFRSVSTDSAGGGGGMLLLQCFSSPWAAAVTDLLLLSDQHFPPINGRCRALCLRGVNGQG